MAKWANDLVMDAALDKISTGTRIDVCSGASAPADRAAAIAASLATATLSGASFTKADGSSSGRKVTVAQQSAISITASGTATHVAISDGSILLLVTTCTSQALTSGGTVTIPAFANEVADPV